jgi:glycosyltransferase involved in cell wall biosynthesis
VSDRRGPVVAHFLRTYAGSTETFVVNQIAALERYEPVVLCRGIDPRTPQSTLGPSPAPLSYSQALGPSLLGDLLYDKARISLPRERAFYRKTLDAQGAQLVHGHFGTDTAYLLKARARWGVPVVVSYYGYDVSRQPQAYGGLGVRYYRQLFREASVHLAMTPQMAEALVALGAPEERVVVHHHGIDTSHWASIDGSRRVPGRILMVARFHEKKGHDDLLQALPAVCARFPDTRLHLVGNGPLEPQLRALVERLGLSGRVVFAGLTTSLTEPLLKVL